MCFWCFLWVRGVLGAFLGQGPREGGVGLAHQQAVQGSLFVVLTDKQEADRVSVCAPLEHG
jgi:hypothetical protein